MKRGDLIRFSGAEWVIEGEWDGILTSCLLEEGEGPYWGVILESGDVMELEEGEESTVEYWMYDYRRYEGQEWDENWVKDLYYYVLYMGRVYMCEGGRVLEKV